MSHSLARRGGQQELQSRCIGFAGALSDGAILLQVTQLVVASDNHVHLLRGFR